MVRRGAIFDFDHFTWHFQILYRDFVNCHGGFDVLSPEQHEILRKNPLKIKRHKKVKKYKCTVIPAKDNI